MVVKPRKEIYVLYWRFCRWQRIQKFRWFSKYRRFSLPLAQDRFHNLQICFGIDTDGVGRYGLGVDVDAILQETQLL